MFRELATFRKQCAGGALAAAGALGGFLFGALGGNLFGTLGRGLLGGGWTLTGAAVHLSVTIHCGWNLVFLLPKDCVSEVPCSRNLINHSECKNNQLIYFSKKLVRFVKFFFFFFYLSEARAFTVESIWCGL